MIKYTEKLHVLCLLYATIVLIANPACAQKSPMNFSRLTIEDGLSQNTVLCLLQDTKGFIWIGTGDGLNRYDGYEFITYKYDPADATSISHNQVNTLLEDKHGNIWVGTANGLNLYDRNTQRFQRLDTRSSDHPVSDDFIASVIQDSYAQIWVGTLQGLKIFSPADSSFLLVGSEGYKTQAIYEDKEKILWVGTGNGLKRIDPLTRENIPLPAAIENHAAWGKSRVRVINQDQRGNYWIGTENEGLFAYRPSADTCINYSHQDGNRYPLPNNMVGSILPVSAEEIWIGTREGLSIYNHTSGHFTNYTYDKNNSASLGHNSVRCFLKDDAGSIWIGTFSGGVAIMQLGNNNFSTISERVGENGGLNNRVASSVVEDDEGGVWIGTEGGALNYVDRHADVFRYYKIDKARGAQRNNVKAIHKNAEGKLWVGTYEGLYLFDPLRRSYMNCDLGVPPHLWQIYALEGDTGGLWIGTFGRGLNYLSKEGTVNTHRYDPEQENRLSSNNITALLNEGDSGLWIGTEHGGLNYFDKSSKKFFHHTAAPGNPFSISSNSILSIYSDSKQRIWVGTRGGGLNLYDKKKQRFYVINESIGLSNNVVHAILEDDSGHLWVSTNKGLSRILFKGSNPSGGQTDLPFSKSNTLITNYTSAEGLQSNQFTSGALKGSDGALFFCGINGVTRFYPNRIVHNTSRPGIVFTDFLIRNKPVPLSAGKSPLQKSITETREITLNYDQAFITFKFAALNFIHPEKNQYAYKLDGFPGDDDWQYVGSQRTATYTNLNAGTYFFRVKAANNDGIWSDKVASIRINVLPPPWKTWWAYLIYAGIICSLLYAFHYYSYKTAELKNKLLFEQRSHDFFINISHEIKTPLTLILAPVEKLIRMNAGNNKVQHQLMLMQRNGERLGELINQLLDFKRFESGGMKLQAAEGDIVQFVKEILAAFQVYAGNRKIRLDFMADSNRISIWFDRDKMEKVLYNLLSNALKFTPENGQVSVYIRQPAGQGHVLIEVEDNGVGIAEQNVENIFRQFYHYDDTGINAGGAGIGLAFSKGLVELHHGHISVTSRRAGSGTPGPLAGPGGYTRFTIKLPLGKDHLSASEIIQDFRDSEHISGYQRSIIPVDALQAGRKKDYTGSGSDKLIMLIVEDNTELLDFMAAHFSEDFDIKPAEDGLSGWEKAISYIPDIIISDVMMPGMNGVALCSKLKSDPRTSHVPVILLTARSSLILQLEGLETGADDYMTKPFNPSLLEARVWNILDSRQKLRERYRKEITLQPTNVAITSADEQFLEKIMQFIEKHISESTLSVEILGKEIGMTRVTLYRKIKALTGQTVVEFVRNIRLRRAAQLLSQDKFQVNEVAYMTGFSDVNYFRKCFKEHFKHSPKEYAGFIREEQVILEEHL